jgi:hypothetical protein
MSCAGLVARVRAGRRAVRGIRSLALEIGAIGRGSRVDMSRVSG